MVHPILFLKRADADDAKRQDLIRVINTLFDSFTPAWWNDHPVMDMFHDIIHVDTKTDGNRKYEIKQESYPDINTLESFFEHISSELDSSEFSERRFATVTAVRPR